MTPIRALLLVLFSNVLFSLMSPVAKLSMSEGVMDGVTLASLRLGGAALLFWILGLFTPKQKIDARDWWRIFLMSLSGMALNQYLFIVGVSLTVPSHAALAATTTPVVTVILARFLFKQHISWLRVGGILLAASGVMVLVLSATGGGQSGSPLGDLMCMCSQLLSSCYFLFFTPMIKKYHPVVLMKWLFLLSALVSTPFVTPHLLDFPWSELSATSITGCVYVVVGSTFLSYLLLLVGQKFLPTSVVVTFIYLQPVIASFASVAWGLESFTVVKLAAALMIALGVWIVQSYAKMDEGKKA